jgi:hypothetical protein
MGKTTKVVLGVVGGIIVIGAIAAGSGNKSNTQTVPGSNSDKSATQATAPAESQKEKLTIKNSAYQEANGLKEVVGEVTNNDSGKHTATIKATFYDAGGKILGTAVGSVNDLAPSETKTFNLYTNDNVTGYKDLKVQIDTLL